MIPTAHTVFCGRVMKELTATATGVSPAEIDQVYERLLDVERYPAWYPDGAKRVTVLERDAEGVPTKVDAVLAAVAGPLRRQFDARLAVERTRPTSIALARVADERGDHELLTIAWLLRDLGPDGTEVTVELGARIDLPPFLPIDPVAREVANGFLQAALGSL
jgi:ribosome-associated toxin RatA of RatAB toxin-antitoxin module